MFVLNLKVDFKKILIVTVAISLIIVTLLEFSNTTRVTNVNATATNTNTTFDYTLDEKNFTQILQKIHENIDSNIGKTVKMSGFVFRMPDFKEGYFVCGRNTIVNSEEIVAGFLCQSDEYKNLVDNEWIEITGVIIKGEYNETMPIIKIGTLKKITAPANTYVDSNISNQTTQNSVQTQNNSNSNPVTKTT